MDILDSKEENCEHEKHLEKVKNFIDNQNSIDDICNLLKILGEPSRLKIVLAFIIQYNIIFNRECNTALNGLLIIVLLSLFLLRT